MASLDLSSMSLPQLKHFLSERGVKTTGYKKNDLLDIAREAKLQSIPTKTDHYVDEAFVQSLTDRSAIGVTDQLAKWTNPTRSSRPVKVIQLDLRRDPNGETSTKPTGQFYKPVYTPQQENRSIEKQVYKLMKTEELEACAAYTLSDSSESECEFENAVHDNVLDLAKTANYTFENFLNVLKMYYNRDVFVYLLAASSYPGLMTVESSTSFLRHLSSEC
uniref:SAP domain-containing protein n=1 Tax=Magallana gigas TaxID=29159 RepID=A0A8W8KEQ0_MAGGI